MVSQGGTHLEELVDQGLGMMEEDTGLMGRASLRGSFLSDSLLAPDTDFMTDDRSSAASGLDVVDRLTYLEQRMQMQEDEIQLLKMTLADVLKRLNVSEEHHASSSGGRRIPGAKASRPVSLVLPPRNPMGNPHAASVKKSSTMPSSGMGRNYTSSPTPSKSSVKDSGCKASKSRPTSAASTCKTAADSSGGGHPAKDPSLTVGTRRVTHCKVTMQIYLSPPARRTGSSEHEAPPTPTTSFFTSSTTIASGSKRSSSSSSGPAGPPSSTTPGGAGQGARGGSGRSEGRRTRPGFTLNLQKTTGGQGLDSSSYKSQQKSPNQYFQICY